MYIYIYIYIYMVPSCLCICMCMVIYMYYMFACVHGCIHVYGCMYINITSLFSQYNVCGILLLYIMFVYILICLPSIVFS